MELSTENKAAVKNLLSLVIHGNYRCIIWRWIKESVITIEQKFVERKAYCPWSTAQIAQALLLTRASAWPIKIWRERIEGIRDWQRKNHTIIHDTRMSPAYTYELCKVIERSGIILTNLLLYSSHDNSFSDVYLHADAQRLRILVFGIFRPKDVFFWESNGLRHSDVLNCYPTFLGYHYKDQLQLSWELLDYDTWKNIMRKKKRYRKPREVLSSLIDSIF